VGPDDMKSSSIEPPFCLSPSQQMVHSLSKVTISAASRRRSVRGDTKYANCGPGVVFVLLGVSSTNSVAHAAEAGLGPLRANSKTVHRFDLANAYRQSRRIP